jgi:hypothetical protein
VFELNDLDEFLIMGLCNLIYFVREYVNYFNFYDHIFAPSLNNFERKKKNILLFNLCSKKKKKDASIKKNNHAILSMGATEYWRVDHYNLLEVEHFYQFSTDRVS